MVRRAGMPFTICSAWMSHDSDNRVQSEDPPYRVYGGREDPVPARTSAHTAHTDRPHAGC